MDRYYWCSGGMITSIRSGVSVEFTRYEDLASALGFTAPVNTDDFGHSMKSRPNIHIYEAESSYQQIHDQQAEYFIIWDFLPTSICGFFCSDIFAVVDVLKYVRDYKQCLDDLLQ